MADDLLEHVADVLGAHEHGPGAGEGVPPPGRELLVAAHRVLELGAVGLDRVARAARGCDRPAEQDVVREHEIGGQVLAEGFRVGRHVCVALGLRQLRQAARVEALVAIEDEDRQQAPDVGPHDLGPAQVVLLRVRFLREDNDLVAGAAPLPREGRVYTLEPVPPSRYPCQSRMRIRASSSLRGSRAVPGAPIGLRQAAHCGRWARKETPVEDSKLTLVVAILVLQPPRWLVEPGSGQAFPKCDVERLRRLRPSG